MSKNRPSLKEKEVATSAGLAELGMDFNDFFAIEPALKKEIEAKGLVYRWVNALKLKANYGYDKRQWSAYKRDGQATGISSFSDPEGYTRRGDLILAVQSKGIANARKAQLDARNKSQSSQQYAKQQAEDLRRNMRDSGIKADISEGYEDNE
jgi:hypothetical protein